MLSYRINQSNIRGDEEPININNTVILGSIDIEETADPTNELLVKCCTSDLGKIEKGSTVKIQHSIPKYSVNAEGNVRTDYIMNYSVVGINEETRTFTVKSEKYMNLPLLAIRKETHDNIDYLYLYFREEHYFVENMFTEDIEEDDNNEIITYATLWLSFTNKFVETAFEYVDENTLRVKWEEVSNNSDLDEMFYSVFTVDSSGIMETDEGNIYALNVYRENLRFGLTDGYTAYYTNPKTTIQIGLTNNGLVDLQKESLINDYIRDTMANAINATMDGEKDIVYPVYITSTNGVITYNNLTKINFNFHFRKRSEKDTWISKDEDYWNGVTTDEDGDLKFINGYFWKNKECQSDVLTCLDFTDSDVKFQKSKLKKSFIRLSIYDSINPAKQNLLEYSSIFMDGGNYFQKYIKHMTTKGYFNIDNPSDRNLKGIKVNRDYSGYDGDDAEAFEEYRLSTQISVKNRYKSTATSESYYIYLWKDILDNLPADGLQVCMKIEFNHAGYGRVVPFMMPFWDKEKHSEIKDTDKRYTNTIKDFQEILDDFNEVNDSDGKYGMRQFIKFSYIYLRIKYDESSKKYIYYLDNEVYGDNIKNVDSEKGILNINLYEAKISS